MIVVLSPLFSEDILKKSDVIVEISRDVEIYMHNKDYGGGVNIFAIGVICVAPEFDSFFRARKTRYAKSRKSLEYDIKLDYSLINNASKLTIVEILIKEIVGSLPKLKKIKIPNFDNNYFLNDLVEFLKSYQAA